MQQHHKLSAQHTGQPDFSVKSMNMFHFVSISPNSQSCPNDFLGHNQWFSPNKDQRADKRQQQSCAAGERGQN